MQSFPFKKPPIRTILGRGSYEPKITCRFRFRHWNRGSNRVGVAWVLTQPTVDELKRKVKLLEDRVYEFQTMYENDLNAVKEEYSILYRQIQEMRETVLPLETKRKVEELFQILEQAYQSKQTKTELPLYIT
jgi:hypothetical protein